MGCLHLVLNYIFDLLGLRDRKNIFNARFDAQKCECCVKHGLVNAMSQHTSRTDQQTMSCSVFVVMAFDL